LFSLLILKENYDTFDNLYILYHHNYYFVYIYYYYHLNIIFIVKKVVKWLI